MCDDILLLQELRTGHGSIDWMQCALDLCHAIDGLGHKDLHQIVRVEFGAHPDPFSPENAAHPLEASLHQFELRHRSGKTFRQFGHVFDCDTS